MPELVQELRYALRTLAKSPGFTLLTVLTLALGIGANCAIFSAVQGVLLKPLPYPEADRLYRVFYDSTQYSKFPVNGTDFMDYRQQNRVFENFAVFTQQDLELSGDSRPQRLTAVRVSSEFFKVLRQRPALGRDFEAADERPGNHRSVILSDNIWRGRFAADPGVIGRTVRMNGEPFVVVGVMPAGFQHIGGTYRSPSHGDTVDAWWPFSLQRGGRGSHFLNGIARLRPGVSAADADRDMNRIAADLGRQFPNTNRDWRIILVALHDEIVGRSQRTLLLLLGSVSFVLLIACVNVANLMLVRASGRARDMAVRAALGATRLRLARHVLVESLVLSISGAACGVAGAFWGVRALKLLLPPGFPRAHMIGVDSTVFAFTACIAIVTAIAFGLLPSMHASRAGLSESLREGGRSASAGASTARVKNILVVAEVALASALLVGGGLFLRSFVNMIRIDPGFRPENVVTAGISLPQARYKTGADVDRFYRDLETRLRELPGVVAAGLSSDLPWTGYDENAGFRIEGRPSQNGPDEPHARFHSATPGFFPAIGTRLLAGRLFDLRDREPNAPSVVIINESMARRYWPGENAIGKRFSFSGNPAEKDWISVAGVVADVKDTPQADRAEPAFWFPSPFRGMSIAVRAGMEAGTLVSTVREEVRRIDPDLPLAQIRTMEQVAGEARMSSRFILLLSVLFAALALALAVVGMYGVLSYSVSQRAREFGVRLALGARERDVVAMVTGQAFRLALAGVAAGLVLSILLGRLVGSLLYGVTPRDPVTLAGAAVLAAAIGLAGAYVPARRAARVDPAVSLRCE